MAFQSSMTVDIFILQFLHDFRFQNNCIFFNDNAYDDNGDLDTVPNWITSTLLHVNFACSMDILSLSKCPYHFSLCF